MRIFIGSDIADFPGCRTYAANVRESQCARSRAPGGAALMLVLVERQRVGPHLAAILVEDQRWIFRRRHPRAARDLVIELRRRPAGIAECQKAVLRPVPKADVAQHLGGIAER